MINTTPGCCSRAKRNVKFSHLEDGVLKQNGMLYFPIYRYIEDGVLIVRNVVFSQLQDGVLKQNGTYIFTARG